MRRDLDRLALTSSDADPKALAHLDEDRLILAERGRAHAGDEARAETGADGMPDDRDEAHIEARRRELHAVLEARFGALGGESHARLAMADVGALDRLLVMASTATSADEVLDSIE